jgi:hypothetical protein
MVRTNMVKYKEINFKGKFEIEVEGVHPVVCVMNNTDMVCHRQTQLVLYINNY